MLQGSPSDKRARPSEDLDTSRKVKPRLNQRTSDAQDSAVFVLLFFLVSALVSLLAAYLTRCASVANAKRRA